MFHQAEHGEKILCVWKHVTGKRIKTRANGEQKLFMLKEYFCIAIKKAKVGYE